MALPSNKSLKTVSKISQMQFPDIIDDKIQTEEFLQASRGIVKIVEKLGKVFAPVKYDMENNIEKLNTKYCLDKEKYSTLQDMLLLEKEAEEIFAAEALMWLRRGLCMILIFLEQIVGDHNSGKKTEDLVAFLKEAYSQSLEPYHGWMIQQLVSLLSRMAPSRTQLLQTIADTTNFEDDILIQEMDIYLKTLRSNIVVLQNFYEKYELETNVKA